MARRSPWLDMDDMELIKSAQLYQTDPETGKSGLNLAGILLLGNDQVILSAVPHHRTDLILRKVNLDRYDDRDLVRTNLIESYERIMAFVQKHLPDPFYLEGTNRISIRDAIFREIHRADELGSGMRNMMRYGKAYGGEDPQMIEGDVFRIIVKVPEYGSFEEQNGKKDTGKGTRKSHSTSNPTSYPTSNPTSGENAAGAKGGDESSRTPRSSRIKRSFSLQRFIYNTWA